jgi:UDP-hydrolysing UDP-N-acetyl-D-glucosamine 2-epimerase
MTCRPRRIAVVTGSRADYGLLRPVLAGLAAHPALTLQLLVTGGHLEPGQGHTLDAILADGLEPARRIPLDQDGDDPGAVTRALGRGVLGFGAALEALTPDLLLVLGDRWEILAAVQAALIARLPVAHIAGGDLTAGAFDDAIRHAITKLSHLHFVTHEQARRRVLQLGEDPARVYLTGSPGLDALLATPRLSPAQLRQALGVPLRRRNLAITFHPETLAPDPRQQLEALLTALAGLGPDTGLFFTGANTDPGGATLNRRIDRFVADHPNAARFPSLGPQRYYSLVAAADAVVGNSSSGLYEAPSLGTATVNIGARQAGRPRAASVLDCPAEAAAISACIHRAFTLCTDGVQNPYGDGHASERILAVLAGDWQAAELLQKRFQDWPPP